MRRVIVMGAAFSALAFGQTELKVLQNEMEMRVNGTDKFLRLYDSGNDDPTLIPSLNEWGMLGTNTNRFWEIHARMVLADNITTLSDERAKKDIAELDDVMGRLKKIRPVSYQLNEKASSKREGAGHREIGFLAQNLKEAFPEVVHHDKQRDIYAVEYQRVVPILLKAIQEQQQIIERQGSQIDAIRKEMGSNTGTARGGK